MSLNNYIDKFKGKNILVVGDIILDKYIKGIATRISPEAPIQIVEVKEEFKVLGGAANVANNICALGGTAHLAGYLGQDNNGTECLDMLKKANIQADAIVSDSSRCTTTKVRLIAERQQIVRFDYEQTHEALPIIQREFFSKITSIAKNMHAIVVSDYAKGVVSSDLIKMLSDFAESNDIPLLVDPRPQNRAYYSAGMTICTPNLNEAYALTGASQLESEMPVSVLGQHLVKHYQTNILITQGAQGMTLFQKDGSVCHIPTYAREVFDIVGAGDTVIAAFSLGLVAGATLEEAAKIANCAAGVVVTKLGTAVVHPNELDENIAYAESHVS